MSKEYDKCERYAHMKHINGGSNLWTPTKPHTKEWSTMMRCSNKDNIDSRYVYNPLILNAS